MKQPQCERIGRATLVDYAAGELSDAEATAVEEHLFACAECGARAADLDALVRAIPPAVRAAEVGGFVTDTLLNRLSRDGVRVRMFTLTPGAVVPCAVWDDDELMVLRLRGDFGGATELTVSRRVGGAEVNRATSAIGSGSREEVLYATPAASIRQLPQVDVHIVLTARDGDDERTIGSYTLAHGGYRHRR